MRTFNSTAVCIPSKHYMVDLTSRLEQIKTMVDAGQYFVVNRARQYGKTTLFASLYRFLKDEYTVVSLDFQALSSASFETEGVSETERRILLERNTLFESLMSKVQGSEELSGTKDKRKTLLYLTDKAHELKQDYDSVSLRMGQIYYQGFSEEEIVRFEGYLDRISRNLEGWRDE